MNARLDNLYRTTTLTLRERQILALKATGRNNREVGLALFIAEPTVKFHLTNVFRKLGAKNTSHALALALRDGILAWRSVERPTSITVYGVEYVPAETNPAEPGEPRLVDGYTGEVLAELPR